MAEIKQTLSELYRLQSLEAELKAVEAELAAGPARVAEIERTIEGAAQALAKAKDEAKEAARKQKSLLRSAYASLKAGGELVYSTCSFAPEENELVVLHLLRKTDAQLLTVNAVPSNSIPGVTAWGKQSEATLAKCVRILPDGPWDGFFLARLRKPERATPSQVPD